MKKVEVAKWLERMPLAPEFRPTDTEFADPIAYISKIEKEASAFGICKVIPPFPKPSRKYVLNNLNKSLLKSPEFVSDINNNCDRGVDDVESRAVFTTRSQELGCEKLKKMKGVIKEQVPGGQKHVWQSGEVYTLEQFEAKSKIFAKSQLGMVKDVNPLVIETMFWKAATEKPIYVEYANDVPGSGFGQPEGSLRHFHRRRRRRKRNSYDRNNSSSSSAKNDTVGLVNCSNKGDEDSGQKNNPNVCTETMPNSLSPAGKDSSPSVEVEGSAGWKLSNCPWNLQVIARSPGSLTKFMPDDIPGVTSPMVYVGMLFSWFAWHVEDHELHSLNYLHMGSPKTWYSVPGDRAFDFEETIRQSAYGGVTDRSVALSRLGEKTTVLSPEAIVASGIPCCRLVQNPGEFVVTFPRAYHIGFSHGFNCGEAANFATPNWLTVAKEAAVRRAAMNYLPMLSHQQLLSLLTMSFISRIPRSLLPGVRSSRLRDRQREEREFLVKRAFIEDILHENNLLTVLLKRSSSYRSVLWDAESLPSSSKESELGDYTDASVLTSIEKNSSETANSVDHDHVCQLDEYIGAVDLDLNDDDMAYDFQMDSGSLPCVACGILGFPFMAVIQPSQAASKNLLPEKPLTVSVESHFHDGSNHVAELSIGELEQSSVRDHSSSIKSGSGFTDVEIDKDWNVANLFLKPRIFCLKHALEIEVLLRPIGGANVLVICHSDFQKIKSHVASIAEEASTPFHFNEISLANASQEDLHLIDIAIDRDEQTNCADWTGKLNVNLQHYLKVKRSSSDKNVQYALTLVGLTCDETASMVDASSVKWLSRKFRSNRQLKNLSQSKISAGVERIEELLETAVGREVVTNNVELIQYSRKRYKSSKSAGREAITDANDVECKHSDIEAKRLDELTITNEEAIAGREAITDTNDVECKHSDIEAKSLDELSITNEEAIAGREAITDTNDVECKHSDIEAKSLDELTITNEETQKYRSENIGTSSHENAGVSYSESQSLTEGETVDNDENEMVHTDQPDVDDAATEMSGSLCPSNTLDGNIQPRCEEETSEKTTSVINESFSDSIEESSKDNDDKRAIVLKDRKMKGKKSIIPKPAVVSKTGSKRKREAILHTENQHHSVNFVKSPCEGLRPRGKIVSERPTEETPSIKKLRGKIVSERPTEETPSIKKLKKASNQSVLKKGHNKERYKCDLDGCTMSFQLKTGLVLHKENRCPVDGCRKKFSTHKYTIQHHRVHEDDRPLKCPWSGCTMSFKWAWARTEHIRVHTGERPYACKIKGCGLTFRYVSDFSRHRRKTGHYVKTVT